jgi:aminoglycoside phosphotransferase (APT) family kinase protein
VHGDLFDEHLLLDDAGCVSGIIDWGDACLADPALDFAGLYAWLGEEFVRQVLDHYGGPVDAAIMQQIAFRARCAALTTYGWSLQGHGTSPADRLQMVRTAFGISPRRATRAVP